MCVIMREINEGLKLIKSIFPGKSMYSMRVCTCSEAVATFDHKVAQEHHSPHRAGLERSLQLCPPQIEHGAHSGGEKVIQEKSPTPSVLEQHVSIWSKSLPGFGGSDLSTWSKSVSGDFWGHEYLQRSLLAAQQKN